MKMLLLLTAILSLNACSATGPVYTQRNKTDIIIYRADTIIAGTRDFKVSANGKDCMLSNAGYFLVDAKKDTVIEVSEWDMAGTSRILAKPGSFIRVDIDTNKTMAAGMAGAFGIGGILLEAGANRSVTSDGPFIFTEIPKNESEQVLKNIHEDCI